MAENVLPHLGILQRVEVDEIHLEGDGQVVDLSP